MKRIGFSILFLLALIGSAFAQRTDIIPYRKDSLWGYCDQNKKILIAPKYKEARPFYGNFAEVKNDTAEAIINIKGNLVTPFCKMVSLSEDGSRYTIYNKDYGMKVIKANGEVINKDWCREIDYTHGYITIQYIGKNVLTDKNGKELFSCKDCYLEVQKNDMALVSINYKRGFLNLKTGKQIPSVYDKACPFYEGLSMVKKGDHWGFIDSLGKEVIPFIYDKVLPEEEETEDFNESTFRGYYYDGFSEGLAVVQKDGKCGYINKRGMVVIPFTYEKAYGFHQGTAWVKKNGLWGMINKKGQPVVPCKYTSISYLSDKELQGLPYFSEGMLNVRKDSLEGFVDESGKEVVPCIYSITSPFSNGLAGVQKNGKWGFIDKTGKIVIPMQFDWVENLGSYEYAKPFDKGYAIALKNDKWMLIDKQGKQLSSNAFESDNTYLYFEYGMSSAKINGKTYLINEKGEILYEGKENDYIIIYGPELIYDNENDCYVNVKTKTEYFDSQP